MRRTSNHRAMVNATMKRITRIATSGPVLDRRVGPRVLSTSVVFGLIIMAGHLTQVAVAAATSVEVSPAFKRAMSGLPEHAQALIALGDVNEDGSVDGVDRTLINAMARTEQNTWGRIAQASCPAAGDLDLDDQITAADVALIDDWIGDGSIVTAPLFTPRSLPCRFDRLLIATEMLSGQRGGSLLLWILDPLNDAKSTTVSLIQGTAEVVPGGDAYQLRINIPEAAEDELYFRLVFDDGQSFSFSLPVDDPPLAD